ncbi:transcription factor bHLH140 isoform X3 [Malania oleifera]|uniref:transcription factor bHLH140 isoform X3 n=1 Tax=Malania oleifera TaxID=397392 RepID=UPI0025ADD59B|nr:transcription factor bHLH140 isoform X3 [Malania oleifera]
MDMVCEPTSRGEEQGKPVLVILVGAPGSGKSAFCERVIGSSARPWFRVCQDTIGNGKSGTKAQCLKSAASALKDGKSVFIDRCNLDREQRAEFMKLGCSQVDVQAVVLDLPAQVCISRSVKRTGHEGNLQGGKAAAVVNRMLQKKELPKLTEGFSRITFCQNDSDVQVALDTYIALGPSDTLPSGCFGQKKPDAKIQLGIRKFLKKVEVPVNASADAKILQDSVSTESSKEMDPCCEAPENACSSSGNPVDKADVGKSRAVGSDSGTVSSNDVPTLAFPSISTSDFHFNLEKASDIIVEKVEEFMSKLENARLVLVDLCHGSKILSLVRAKAAQKNINSDKFFTFVGDITRLYTGGGLRCNVIANAANWRLKPGGGGVNAAIFNAAGPAFDAATKLRAGSLLPGKALVVPLASSSPLFSREGVTHVIHVLGPNMNPQRPNCLNNDYIKGCKVLREVYLSLFEAFISLVKTQANSSKRGDESSGPESESQDYLLEEIPRNHFLNSEQKFKREGVHESDSNKKSKGVQEVFGHDTKDCRDGKEIPNKDKIDKSTIRSWGSWAQALYNITMHPERHMNEVLEISDDVVVLNDLFPKAQWHLLVLARFKGLDCLADVQKEHLSLLKTMHTVGLKWAEKFLSEDSSCAFRLGYHLNPSMRQLHLHVISQDFNSKHLKNKKHWNSFNSGFFRDSVDVIEEISNHGKATLKDDDTFLSMELRCHRCRSAHPNIPRLKSHISHCKAPFPSTLLQNGRLVLAPGDPVRRADQAHR